MRADGSRRPDHRRTPRRPATALGRPLASALLAVALVAGRAAAHVGGLGGVVDDPSVPPWLTVATGGAVIGASFLFTSLLTDHEAIRYVNAWRLPIPVPTGLARVGRVLGGALGLGVLALVVVTGLLGPSNPTTNPATLVVWTGWWAGFTMSVYLLGNAWPAVNPWRALSWLVDRAHEALGGGDPVRTLPDRVGVWPAVVGLLALVWLEVISPVAEQPPLLAGVVVAYSLVTLVGAVLYGPGPWFGRIDPVARVFATYGRLAPLQRTDRGLALALPTAVLASRDPADAREATATPGQTAFVVALLWVTTFDGVVTTPAWEALAGPLVRAGVPAVLVYLVALMVGFWVFRRAYRAAARKSRETAGSFVSRGFIERWFAPSLLPIAAGYHLAHFLGYLLTLSPALAAVLARPFAPPATVEVLVLPGWFGTLGLLFVLGGHLGAIWVAHSLSFDLFPGTLKPIRSQYPFIVVMIAYTMTSVWILIQPFQAPPFV